MKTFRGNSPHREAMQKLAGWCDEASFAHWEQDSTAWPSWSTHPSNYGAAADCRRFSTLLKATTQDAS